MHKVNAFLNVALQTLKTRLKQFLFVLVGVGQRVEGLLCTQLLVVR